jgi:cyclopropane-fatty-acyl-phospholipid synthase
MAAILRSLGRIEVGTVTVMRGDCEWLIRGSDPGPSALLRVNRPASLLGRVSVSGAVGLAESYMRGDWDSPDLTDILVVLALNEAALSSEDRPVTPINWINRLRHRANRNSIRGSRRNIAAHYDLGNDFYRLWLDATMTYSAALFGDGDRDLESAQRRKYGRLLNLLGARPGQRLLEIGCGWGGLAVEAARRGLQVTGVTLSREQLELAMSRVRAEGLEGSVELRLQDYRQLQGAFDHLISIEMLEAVGEENWHTYARTLKARLAPGGRAALQFITIEDDCYEVYRKTPDFVQRYIFPGGMLPSPERFRGVMQAVGLRPVREDYFGSHYARTLADWHRRFLDAERRIAKLGYDERFRRMWRYYLSYCEAGFRIGRIDLAQILLEHEYS